MGHLSLKRKSVICLFFTLFLSTLLTIILSVLIFNNPKIDNFKIKNDYEVYVIDIENNNSVKKNYVRTDLDGKVESSTISKYKVGNYINMHQISSSSDYYVEALTQNNSVYGFVLIDINYSDYYIYNFSLLIFILIIYLLIIIITIRQYLMNTRDIFNPILDIHKETKEIINGNYNVKLKYDYITDVGSLSHDIEALRDELSNSQTREKKLKDNEKLLLACISHDLKTPVACISGYAQGIRDGVYKGDESINHCSDIIINKTMILTKLIDDILEHSKLELNEFSIKKEEVYSNLFFTEAFKCLISDAQQKNIELSVDDVPKIIINIDQQRMTQVVNNIISNSIKYGRSGGKINVSFIILNDYLNVYIKDDGIGIKASDLPFVFDKFYRGDDARGQNISGSGLGLNICKYIVESHGGNIYCDSILNKGTTIMFSIPINK